MDFYELKIEGLSRKLPLVQVGKSTKIASFSILGDVELCNKLADKIADELRDKKVDVLVGPEVKVVPLIHGIAARLDHKKYAICRKSKKSYMVDPITVKPLDYFPKHVKPLVLDGQDANILKNKSVYIIDDVISTGVTMRMINYLMSKVEAKVEGYYAVFKQGEQFDKFENLKTFYELPIIKED